MIEQIPIDDWMTFDRAHPAPTFFARPAWALALSDVYKNAKPALLRIQTRSAPAVLMPALEMRSALRWKSFAAFPLGGYTCFMHEDGTLASESEATLALREVGRFADVATIVPWPFGPAPSEGVRHPHTTSVVDLSAGLENALARIDGKYRRMAGQAERRGVDCVQFTGVDAVDTYYGLLRESAKRWGIPEPAERRALISALQQYGGSSVEIWFALFEDRPIAGGVVFYGSREFFFWSAAMLAEFGRLRPSNALNYALLHAAAAKGMRWYNLGASEGLPGVERFKSGLGAQDVPYEALELSRIPFKLYTNVKRVLAARVHR
jgi:hypothetical protein